MFNLGKRNVVRLKYLNQEDKVGIGLFIMIALTACAPSPNPKVQDLVSLSPPTLNGITERAFTSSSNVFVLSGECDSNSLGMEYSKDMAGGNWLEIPDGCSNGTFSIAIKLTKGIETVYVRGRGRFTFTDAAIARIRYLLPPTAPLITAVSSSASNVSDDIGWGTQNAIGIVHSGTPLANSRHRVSTFLPGVIYGD